MLHLKQSYSLRVAAPVLDYVVFILLPLCACGKIEINLGPKNGNSCYNFSIRH